MFPRAVLTVLLPILCSGCYAGAVGVALGIAALSGRGDGSVINNPPSEPAIAETTRVDAAHVLLGYALFDDDGGSLEVTVEWQPAEEEGGTGAGWLPAREFQGEVTLPTGEKVKGDGTRGIVVQAGVSRPARFIWDAREDLRRVLNGRSAARARLRITSHDPAEGGQERPQVTDAFTAGNEPPSIRCIETTDCLPLDPGGNIRLEFVLADSTSDPVHLRARFCDGSAGDCGEGGAWSDMTLLGNEQSAELKTAPGGVRARIVWNSAADLPHGVSASVRVRIIPLDPFEQGEPLQPVDVSVDNNADPVVQVDLAGSPDRSFEVPVRLVIQDADADRVSVALQWALQNQSFPGVPRDPAGLAFLEDLLTLPDTAEVARGNRSQTVALWRRELHLLSEAPVPVRGLVDDSSDLPRNQVRASAIVRQGLVFRPAAAGGPRDLPARPFRADSDVFIAGREIRLYQENGPLDLRLVIREFDPVSSLVTLSGDRPEPLPPWCRFEVRANGGLARLSSSKEGLLHAFVWDSLRDLAEAGIPLDSEIQVRAIGFDAQAAESPPSLVRLQSGPIVPLKSLILGSTGDEDHTQVAAVVGDLDGNGIDDLAVQKVDGEVSIFFQGTLGGDCDPCVPEEIVRYLPGGGAPAEGIALALGDLDADGKLDLVLAVDVFGVGALAVFYQKSQGEFFPEPKLLIEGIPKPSAVEVADFDGDGRTDLIVASYDADEVVIHLLDGERGHLPTGMFLLDPGKGPTALAAGDIDGDGRTDLAVSNKLSNTLSVFLQEERGVPGKRAAGRFEPSFTFETGKFPVSVALGHLNSYGLIDIAVANRASDSATLFMQGPPGSFRSREIATGAEPQSARIADLDLDGRHDLAIADSLSDSVSVFLQGPGGIPGSPSQTLSVVGVPIALAIGDLDGDGRKDLGVARKKSRLVDVFVGRPPGSLPAITYARGVTLRTGKEPIGAAIGDLDGDGRNDVAIANGASGSVSVYRQSSSGTLPSEASLELIARSATSLAIGDLDGDGHNDLAVSSRSPGEVKIFLGRIPSEATATVTPHQTIAGLSDPTAVATGDLDGDGRIDLVVADRGPGGTGRSEVKVYLQVAAGQEPGRLETEPSIRLSTAEDPNALAIGDLDGDGRNELATACGTGKRLTVHFREPAGAFPAVPNLSLDIGLAALAVAIGDVTGEGRNDIVLAHFSGYLVFDGLPKTVPRELFEPEGGSRTGSCVIGDLDGDRRADVAGSVASTIADPISVFIQGQHAEPACGKFPCYPSFLIHMPGTAPHPLALGDLNGDGRDDLIIVSFGNDSASVFLTR